MHMEMIDELKKLSEAETVSPQQFQQLALIVLELAQTLEKQQSERRLKSRMNDRE